MPNQSRDGYGAVSVQSGWDETTFSVSSATKIALDSPPCFVKFLQRKFRPIRYSCNTLPFQQVEGFDVVRYNTHFHEGQFGNFALPFSRDIILQDWQRFPFNDRAQFVGVHDLFFKQIIRQLL